VNPGVATISSGLLSAGTVGSDTPVTVSASYSAGGITKTASANVTIVNSGGGGMQTTDLIVNGGFENGTTGWSATTVGGGTIPSTGIGALSYPHGGSWYAYLGNVDNALGSVHQFITIPANAQSVTLSFYLNVVTTEISIGNPPFDVMDVNLKTTGDTLIRKVAPYSEADKGGNVNGAYTLRTMDLTPYIAAYKGQQVILQFYVDTDGFKPTIFRIDDVSVQAVVPLPVTLTSLAISGPSSVNEGTSAQYAATMIYSDGSIQPATALNWGNNTPSVVSFTLGGLLSAGLVNQDTVVSIWTTATVNGQNYQAFKDVTVVNQAVTFSSLAISGPSSMNENSAGQFTATAIYSDGTPVSVSPSWSVISGPGRRVPAAGSQHDAPVGGGELGVLAWTWWRGVCGRNHEG
jgi:hypothetical protein